MKSFCRFPVDSLHCRGSRGFDQSAATQAGFAVSAEFTKPGKCRIITRREQ
jgi:hypothetical protein